MRRLLSACAAALAYFSIATVLAALILLGIGWYGGKLTGQTLSRLRAALHDQELAATAAGQTAPDVEQPSYEEILEQRAINFRQLELREQVVRQTADLVNRQRADVVALRQAFDQAQKAFNDQLAALAGQTQSSAEENVRLTFENIKPPQAKQLLLLMLDRGELDKVVALLAAMPVAKRAKIAAEFKTPEETTRLSKILELMGDGAPLAGMIEQARGSAEQQPTQR
jgi:hypothetical protein